MDSEEHDERQKATEIAVMDFIFAFVHFIAFG
jgi:hypothetical protein